MYLKIPQYSRSVFSELVQDTTTSMASQHPESQPSPSVELPLQPSPVLVESPLSPLQAPSVQSREFSPGRPVRERRPRKMYDPATGTYVLPSSS